MDTGRQRVVKSIRTFRVDSQGPLRGSSSPFGTLSWQELNPIKLVPDPYRPDGGLSYTASTFNQLGQLVIPAVLVAGHTAMQNSRFPFLAVAVTIGVHIHRGIVRLS